MLTEAICLSWLALASHTALSRPRRGGFLAQIKCSNTTSSIVPVQADDAGGAHGEPHEHEAAAKQDSPAGAMPHPSYAEVVAATKAHYDEDTHMEVRMAATQITPYLNTHASVVELYMLSMHSAAPHMVESVCRCVCLQ